MYIILSGIPCVYIHCIYIIVKYCADGWSLSLFLTGDKYSFLTPGPGFTKWDAY